MNVSIAAVRALILRILEHDSLVGMVELRAQTMAIASVAGPATMIEIVLAEDSPRSDVADGPVRTKPTVVDSSGDEIGELLLWVSGGRLSGLEFAWWTDSAPAVLPAASQLRF